jgi:hypothetical protein
MTAASRTSSSATAPSPRPRPRPPRRPRAATNDGDEDVLADDVDTATKPREEGRKSVFNSKRVALTDQQRAERCRHEQELTDQAVAQLRCSDGWQRWLTVRARVGLRRYSVLIWRASVLAARNHAASVDDMSSTVARLGGGVIHGRTGQRWTWRREVSDRRYVVGGVPAREQVVYPQSRTVRGGHPRLPTSNLYLIGGAHETLIRAA